MSMGRPLRPGDGTKYRGGLQESPHDRLSIGQIEHLDPNNGIAKVTLLQHGTPVLATIPLGGFSINSHNSSWRRYMPQDRDVVQVGYDADNQPYIIGYMGFGEEPSVNVEGQIRAKLTGYAAVRKLREDKVLGFKEFYDLKPGEWHDRSSGGASVYGTSGGQLMLAAGNVGVTLDKTVNEVQYSGSLQRWTVTNSEMRLGDVKRKLLPLDPLETRLTATGVPAVGPLSPAKEWHLKLASETGPASYTYYDEHAGDILDGLVPRIGPTLLTRYDQRIYDGTITEQVLFRFQVDNLGNVQRRYSTTALTVEDSGPGPATVYTSSFFKQVIGASLPTAGLQLGSSAAFQSVTYGVPMTVQLNLLATQVALLMASYVTLAAALANPAAGLSVLFGVPPAAAVAGAMIAPTAAVTAVVAATTPATAAGTLYSLKVLSD